MNIPVSNDFLICLKSSSQSIADAWPKVINVHFPATQEQKGNKFSNKTQEKQEKKNNWKVSCKKWKREEQAPA